MASSAHSILNSSLKEEQWVIQMSGILNRECENNIHHPVCIFQLPGSVSDVKPEAYTPQVIALGPYHHFRPKLYKMQRCKLSEALRAHEQLNFHEFKELFTEINEQAREIRAHYHENLNISDDTLSCIMVIDGLFLLKLIYASSCESSRGRHLRIPAGGQQSRDGSSVSSDQYVDSSGRKYSKDAILKDIILLENQIPNIVLEALLMRSQNKRIFYSLTGELVEFCTAISPIELQGNAPSRGMAEPQHLLDVLHQLVWLGKEEVTMRILSDSAHGAEMITESDIEIWTRLWELLPILNIGFIGVIVQIVDVTLSILNSLGISIPRDFSEEEFLIPSASQLSAVGVKFCRVRRLGGIRDISFKTETKRETVVTFSLPALKLHANTEVVMRNLLAYEAMSTVESPHFTRYIELMSGLVRSVSDIELLKKDDIQIVPHSVDSVEVMKLFSSLKESIGSKGKSEQLDEAIAQINEYYNNTRKVKVRKLTKRYLFISWKVLTALAMMLGLLLMGMQTFCSVYSCPNLFKTSESRASPQLARYLPSSAANTQLSTE